MLCLCKAQYVQYEGKNLKQTENKNRKLVTIDCLNLISTAFGKENVYQKNKIKKKVFLILIGKPGYFK